MLVEHLPPDSATKTAMRNALTAEDRERLSHGARPDLAAWSGAELLLASVLDAIRAQTAVAIAAAGGTPTMPDPTPRPGIPPKTTTSRRLSDEQRRALDPRLRHEPPREA
ncbi:hypothetical protein [Kitasatospora sp. NPDC101183]|uniref:hypothetical protein n=1 Tax=Kitasatospora sp. NPDC101183 TaxID=3364100 RepID=UPI0038013F3C